VVHAIYLSLGRKYDHRNELKNITADTLVIYGRKDVYPTSMSEEYTKLIPNSEKEIIAGVGHFSYDEKPEYFAQLVKNFLKE
jgi:pimeloyl-ACP methyl ester carboxylesterase